MKFLLIGTALLSISLHTFAQNPLSRSASAEGALAYIISPAHGETVRSPFKVTFGLSGMGVAPAGIDVAKTGHHHILIDTAVPALDRPLPATDQIRHFGGGQTEVWLTLPPGRHTLQLLLGDKLHIPHDPPVMSERITVNVIE